MTDAAGHFFYFRYSVFFKAPFGSLIRPFLLLLLLLSSQHNLISQNYQSLKKEADNYFENEQYYNAAQYYQVAVGLEPEHPEIIYRLAQSYKAIFNYPLAAIYYEKAQQMDVLTYPLAPFYLAQMNKATGKFQLARDQFQKFIRENQDNRMFADAEREKFLAQAAIEQEGCKWALNEIHSGFNEKGFDNLPSPINTPYNDYAVAIFENDSAFTLTSGRRGVKGALLDNRYGDYFTDNLRFQKKEVWEKDTRSDRFDQVNSKYSDGAGTYNSNKDKYYFTSCYDDKAFCQLYVAELKGGRWRTPIALNQEINFPGYDNRHPSLTPSGDTLIFVSNRPGGKGGSDLWFSINPGGEDWQPAQLMKGSINTPFNEITPYYHEDGTLFFSSDGHVGMGGMDVYLVTNFGSSVPVTNMGIPFNSGFDDTFFTLGENKGFLSSNRIGGFGKFDIYSFAWPGSTAALAELFKGGTRDQQLRSRIRDYGNSNLFAARDEDQFYYDNLTAEERAMINRILAAKRTAEGNFDPRSLAPEDFKYYRKLDIETKAIIERLAQRKALEIPGVSPTLPTMVLDPLQQSDWAFYENSSDLERAIIDRIIEAKIEDRRDLILNELTTPEQDYWNTSTTEAHQRIEDQSQIQNLDILEEDLSAQTERAEARLVENEVPLNSLRPTPLGSVMHQQVTNNLSNSYQDLPEDLSGENQLFYEQLSPAQQNDLQQLALRQHILRSALSEIEQQRLISELNLPLDLESRLSSFTSEERDKALQVIDFLTDRYANRSRQLPLASANAFELLSFDEQMHLELEGQEMALKNRLEQVATLSADLQDINNELHEQIENNELANPTDQVVEAEIGDKIANRARSFVPRKLTPKEAFFFQRLTPRKKLSIDRLANFINVAVDSNPDQQLPDDLAHTLTPVDQAYLKTLPVDRQQFVQHLVRNGPDDADPEERQYFENLNPLEQARLGRMSEAYQKSVIGISETTTTLEHEGDATRTLQDYLDRLSASDLQFYENQSAEGQDIIKKILTNEGEDPLAYTEQEHRFIQQLDPQQKEQLLTMTSTYQEFITGVKVERTSVMEQTVTDPSFQVYLEQLPPNDLQFYENQSAADKKTIESLVLNSQTNPQTYSIDQREFMDQLSPVSRQRIEDMIDAFVLDKVNTNISTNHQLNINDQAISTDTFVDPEFIEQLSSNQQTFWKSLSPQEKELAADILTASSDVTINENQEAFLAKLDQNEGQKFIEIREAYQRYQPLEANSSSLPATSLQPILSEVTIDILTDLPPEEQTYLNGLSTGDQEVVAGIITKGMSNLEEHSSEERQFLSALGPVEKQHLQGVVTAYRSHHPGAIPAWFSKQPVVIKGHLAKPGGNQIMANQRVLLKTSSGKLVATDTTDLQGNFQFSLARFEQAMELSVPENNRKFNVRDWQVSQQKVLENTDVKSNSESQNVTSSENPDQNKVNQGTNLPRAQELQRGAVIYFDFDRFTLRTEAKKTIEDLASYVGNRSGVSVLVTGHTDFVGPNSYNQKLSEKRSTSTAQYFAKLNPQVQTQIEGFGESQPIESNTTRFGRQFNRRVELFLQGNDVTYQASMRIVLIKPGVRLSTLAQAIGVTEAQLRQWNGLLSQQVRPYQPLRLSKQLDFEKYQSLVFDPLSEKEDFPDAIYHVVAYGETLFRLAQKYHTSVQELEQLNQIAARDLVAGQRIRVR